MLDPRIVVLVNNKVLAPEQAREELLRTVEARRHQQREGK